MSAAALNIFFMIASCVLGNAHGQFPYPNQNYAQSPFTQYGGMNGPSPFGQYGGMGGPPGPLLDPRNSAGSGPTNYNNYNGAPENYNNGGDRGDSLAALGLGGLSGFYSALSNELVYAGNNVGGSGGSSSGPSKTIKRISPSSTAAPGTVTNSTAAGLNLGDTSVLKQYGLEQLGTFFGSMVSELNNAGSNGQLNGAAPPVIEDLSNESPATVASTTSENISSSTISTSSSR